MSSLKTGFLSQVNVPKLPRLLNGRKRPLRSVGKLIDKVEKLRKPERVDKVNELNSTYVVCSM